MPALNAIPISHMAATSAETDVELALAAAGGSAMAFETIVRRNNRLLFRTARGVVPDDAEAQDVVQETYLRAFTHLRSYRGDATLATWLARIAINVAVTSQRRKGRFVQLQENADAEDHDPMERAMSLHAQDDEGPDAAAERKEMRALLQASIEDLPVIYRSVFMLRAVQDLSVEETAYCLSVSEDVVKTRFLRARAMLRDKLAMRLETFAQDTFSFAGERCDAVLAHVMAQLLDHGLVRLH